MMFFIGVPIDFFHPRQIILYIYELTGSFVPGSVKPIGLGSLDGGIGDTIRVSLSDDPNKEVKIGMKF